MRIRGSFDTRVPPGVLFDITNPAARPPGGALEVQFRSPVSLSVLLDGMAQAGLDAELDEWDHAYRDLLDRLLPRVQQSCGFAVETPGTAAAARLELAGITEHVVPGMTEHRWHCHVYIGPTATVISTGERRPIAREVIHRKIGSLAYPFYASELRALAAQLLDVEWGQPRPGAPQEIVKPPWHEHMGTNDRGVCPGPWPRTADLIVADEKHLRLRAEAEEQIRRDRAAGYNPEPDWRAARASDERRLAGAPPISWWQQ